MANSFFCLWPFRYHWQVKVVKLWQWLKYGQSKEGVRILLAAESSFVCKLLLLLYGTTGSLNEAHCMKHKVKLLNFRWEKAYNYMHKMAWARGISLLSYLEYSSSGALSGVGLKGLLQWTSTRKSKEEATVHPKTRVHGTWFLLNFYHPF